MTVGIIGLGLIGGSMARAYQKSGFTVLGCDTNDVVLSWAKLNGIADENLTNDNIPDCDLILLAITPKSAAKWLEDNAPSIAKTTLVMDLCGTKRYICSRRIRSRGKVRLYICRRSSNGRLAHRRNQKLPRGLVQG